MPEATVLDQVKVVFRSIQIPPKFLNALLAHMKASHEAENQFHRDAITRLRHEYDRVRGRLAVLLDLRLDKSITGDEYDRKARVLKGQQTEITLRIEQHQKGEGDYRTTLETLISLASRAAELFERSKTEQKHEFLAFVFSNLHLRGKTLEFSLRSPFDLMVNRDDHASWRSIESSNRPTSATAMVSRSPRVPVKIYSTCSSGAGSEAVAATTIE